MLRPEHVQQRLMARPFQPLRVIANAGLQYDIYHPEMVMVGDRDITIGLSQSQGTIYERQVRVALMHVVGLEDLPPVPAGPASEAEA